MSSIQIPNLPAVIGLSGTELFEGVQAGASVKISLSQIIAATRAGLPTTLPLPVSVGGTGLDTFTIGDIMYASATQTLSKLSDVATGNAIISGGVGVAPSYGKIGLTTHVSGVLPVVNGGTGVTTSTGTGSVVLSNSPALTGQVSFADGTAAAPSIAHTGDLNAGLFFPAADTVAVATAGTERMRVSSAGDVGIGTASPSASLDVLTQVTGALGISLRGRSSDNVSDFSLKSNDAATVYGQIQGRSTDLRIQTGTALPITFFTNSTERMRIDSSGNVGIGVTPSAWVSASKAVQLPGISLESTSTTAGNIFANAYRDSSFVRRYVNTGTANQFDMSSAGFRWFNAPSGTAGDAITFTQSMTLDASGNLGIGTSSPVNRLQAVGAAPATVPAAGASGHQLGVGTTPYGVAVGALSDGSGYIQATRWDGAATNYQLLLQPNGNNVGIGTNAPDALLSVNGAASFGDGSAASPSIANFGDLNTGLFFPAADTVAVSTAGAERFRIGSAGQFGIGGANYGTTGHTIVSAGSGAAPAWGTLPLAGGGTGVTTAPAAAAVLLGYTSTPTAAGTTVLTNTSTQYQLFTGATTQTITLPVTSTLGTGWSFHIVNNSTGSLTVNSSGGNLVCTVISGMTAMVTCIGTALTTAADWEFGFTDFGTITGTGAVVLASSPAITGGSIDNMTVGATTQASVRGTSLVSNSVITDGFITHANGTLALAFATDGVAQVTPNATGTFTTTVPAAGTRSTLIVLTSGVTSYTMTFGTGFKTTGTLATGTVSARYFIFQFISDGTSVIEASRTVAIA
jgi:hypothetical protein